MADGRPLAITGRQLYAALVQAGVLERDTRITGFAIVSTGPNEVVHLEVTRLADEQVAEAIRQALQPAAEDTPPPV